MWTSNEVLNLKDLSQWEQWKVFSAETRNCLWFQKPNFWSNLPSWVNLCSSTCLKKSPQIWHCFRYFFFSAPSSFVLSCVFFSAWDFECWWSILWVLNDFPHIWQTKTFKMTEFTVSCLCKFRTCSVNDDFWVNSEAQNWQEWRMSSWLVLICRTRLGWWE